MPNAGIHLDCTSGFPQRSLTRKRTGTQSTPDPDTRNGLPNSSRKKELSRFFRCSYKFISGAIGAAR